MLKIGEGLLLTNADKPLSIDLIENQIICGDVLQSLRFVPNESVSLIFCSPPYNTDIPYNSHNDNMPWIEYLKWLKQIWIECNRILRPGGRLAINIDAITNWDGDRDTEYIRPIYAELVNMIKDIDGLNFRTEIMWLKHQVVGRATAWGSYMSCSNPIVRRNHEYILVWSKGQWQLPGDSEQSDMKDHEFQEWTMSTWDVAPEGRKLGGHPVPFPEKLCERVIKLFSYRNDLVLDPFSGSGTTCAVAGRFMRRYIGIDIDPKYCKYAAHRASVERSNAEQAEEFSPYVPRSQRPKTVSETSKKKNRKSVSEDQQDLTEMMADNE